MPSKIAIKSGLKPCTARSNSEFLPTRAQSPGTRRPMLHGVRCYPSCSIKPNINTAERPNPTSQSPLCSLKAPAQLHTKPRHGQAGRGHYTTHGAAHPSTAFQTQDRNCLLHIPSVPGRSMLEAPRATEGAGCDQPGQLQVISVRFRRRLCPAELKCNSVERKLLKHTLWFSRILPLFRLHSYGLVLPC